MPATQPKKRWWWLGPAASVTIFVASIGVLYVILQEISISEVLSALADTPRDRLWLAVAFTVLSYAVLTFYDALALKKLGLSIDRKSVV